MTITPLRLAITADLHWGIRPPGDEATRQLVAHLRANPPDVLVLAGDVGADVDFVPCLKLFADLPCRKALVPGNHDIWVREGDSRGDSLTVYREYLPRVSAAEGFHFLDAEPLLLPEANLAIVGNMNWYDYSWSAARLSEHFPGEEFRLRTKQFLRGRHNDARFVRWPLDDVRFTAEVAVTLRRHLESALATVGHAIVVTHHPAFYGLNFPRDEPPTTLDGLLWDAFSGNTTVERLIEDYAERISLVLSGHTHRARENRLRTIRGYNVGGDYHFKRLLTLTWPDGAVEAQTFGDP